MKTFLIVTKEMLREQFFCNEENDMKVIIIWKSFYLQINQPIIQSAFNQFINKNSNDTQKIIPLNQGNSIFTCKSFQYI